MTTPAECDAMFSGVVWTAASSLVVLGILFMITIMVVLGNCLVIAAVFISSKLKTVTNLFIVSLAVADLNVGVLVLPFSATWEVYKVWIFGDLWCSTWLAVDVWMCTASILNLCAISLDRYLAVTRPVNYPSIMSPSRAKILIAGVWILSFVICFPPLVGWKDSRTDNDTLYTPYATAPQLGSGTVRIRGSHTVITDSYGFENESEELDDSGPLNKSDIVSYHTNFSEHYLVRYPKSSAGTSLRSNNAKEPGDSRLDFQQESNYIKSQIYKYQTNLLVSPGPRHHRVTPDADSAGADVLRKRSVKAPSRLSNHVRAFSGVPIVVGEGGGPVVMVPPMTEAAPAAVTTTLRPRAAAPGRVPCKWTCELTSDPGYVIYSALGSFFIPMGVMLFFYWRIYKAAVQTTKAINQGFRTTKGTGGFGNRFEEQRLTLRIHRGRGSVQNHSTCSSVSTATTNGGKSSLSASPSTNSTMGKSPEAQRIHRTRSRSRDPPSKEPIQISVSYPSSDQISSGVQPPSPGPTRSSPEQSYLSTPPMRRSPEKKHFLRFSPKRFSSSKEEVNLSVHYTNKNGKDGTSTNVYKSRDPNCYLRVTGARLAASHNRRSGQRNLSIDSTNSSFDDGEGTMSRRNSTRSQCLEQGESGGKDLSPSPTFDGSPKPKTPSKMGKRNIKSQVKRFRMETKAAKTLGIIVGGFILCWMPFFTIYLVRAFCDDCINPLVFSILFWLGYCNSAINPCIYALFSKDFRFAFKRIICRCLCGNDRQPSVKTKRRGSDISQLNARHTTPGKRSPSCNPPNSVGEDSDQGASDSR